MRREVWKHGEVTEVTSSKPCNRDWPRKVHKGRDPRRIPTDGKHNDRGKNFADNIGAVRSSGFGYSLNEDTMQLIRERERKNPILWDTQSEMHCKSYALSIQAFSLPNLPSGVANVRIASFDHYIRSTCREANLCFRGKSRNTRWRRLPIMIMYEAGPSFAPKLYISTPGNVKRL